MWSEAVSPRLSLACVIKLQTNTLTARLAAIALETSRTSKLGARLVNSDPGPMVIRSALSMASSATGRGFAFAGAIRNSPLTGGDVGFSADEGAVVHDGIELRVAGGRGIDMPAGGQNLRRMFHRLAEVAGDGCHGRKKEIAEVVSAQA